MTAYFAVAHLKGGTGATTVAVNLAAGLALKKRRTVLLDLDPIAAATFHLATEPPRYTVADCLERRVPVAEALVSTGVPNLSLLPGGRALASWDRKPERFPVDLSRVLEELPAETESVVIDLPPSENAIVRGALAVLPGGRVLAPVQTRALDLVGFSDLVQLLEEMREQNENLHLAGVIPVRLDKRALSAEVLEALQQQHGDRVLPGIRESAAVARAPLRHLPVQLTAPHSPGAQDFEQLARRLSDVARTAQLAKRLGIKLRPPGGRATKPARQAREH